MKTFSLYLLVFLVMITVMDVNISLADLANSKHNLSASNNTNTPHVTDTAVSSCGSCHVLHGSMTTSAGLPLWARESPSGPNTYVVYGSSVAGMQGKTNAGTPVNQPGQASLTCLSCHDGTVGLSVTYKNGIPKSRAMTAGNGYITASGALDWFGYNASGSAYNPVIGGSAGDDLTNDHPVGMLYTPGVAGLGPIADAETSGFVFYDYGTGKRLECSSCHDPHNTSYGSFLRRPKSNLCQECHILQ